MPDPLREFDKGILPEEPSTPSPPADEANDLGNQARRQMHRSFSARGPIRRTPRIPTSDHETANVAVVFVHGMGSSSPGNMLEGYMNPSLDWIKRATTEDHTWYLNNDIDANLIEGVNILERNRKPGPSPVTQHLSDQPSPTISGEVDIETLRYALLKSTSFTPANFQPPYLDVNLTRRAGETVETKKLVAVEAWWDGEFQAPPFRLVAQWALGVAPSLILRHLALVWSMDPGRDANTLSVSDETPSRPSKTGVPGALVFTLAGGLLAILFQWIICLLLLLGAVPFLRKYVSKLILAMTTSFGDVLVYVHDGVRSAAIRSTVLRSFHWLLTSYKVEKLIVVAHSLGTVISYDVLNSRDFLRKISGQDVTFVTFGSPLKKANVLLQLKRDEQRVSLGILFAMLSFLCMIAALLVAMYAQPDTIEDPLDLWQWLFIASIGVGVVALGIGAHARPQTRKLPFGAMMLNLSTGQYFGFVLGLIGLAVLIAKTPGWQRILPVIILIAFAWWAVPVSMSRFIPNFDPHRLSQSLTFGLLLLVAVIVAATSGFLPLAGCLIMSALILSVLTASNPLEEFRPEGHAYVRQLPRFSFGTPIKNWIDFWATNDLVAEYGLGDVQYTTSADAETTRHPISRRVTNMRSFLGDHTTYRQNLEQFIAPLTRLFLEELGFRTPDHVAGQDLGAFANGFGSTPIRGNYEQDITTTMRSRANRVRWLSWAGLLLMATMLLFSPGVYRSVGEFIVFDERNPVSLSGDGQPIEAPGWFTTFYNEQPKVCGEILCRIRHLPIVPADVSETLIRSRISGNVILYGLGYGIALALTTLTTRLALTLPWKAWESAILDTLLHKHTSLSRNRLARASVFFLACAAVVVFALAVNNPWLGMTWVWKNDLSPLQTVGTLLQWITAPLR